MIFLLFSLFASFSLRADPTWGPDMMSPRARHILCDTLLQTEKRLVDLPLNGEGISSILNQLSLVYFLDPEAARLHSFTNPYNRDFVFQIVDTLGTIRDPAIPEIIRTLNLFRNVSVAPQIEIFAVHDVTIADQKAIEANVRNELAKIPPRLVSDIWRAGRSLIVVPGQIVEHPRFARFRSRVVANGQVADIALGAAANVWRGPALINWNALDTSRPRSTLLHEVFHLIDSTATDLFDGALRYSARPDFQLAWESTNWLPQDSYLARFRHEAFAEGAMAYVYSKESRETLRHEYPYIFLYFERFFRQFL